MSEKRRLGLIVNPVAGIGGRVGLKGSDGAQIQKRAFELGAVPRALDRAVQALERIPPMSGLEVVTYPGEMGEDAARACGFEPIVVGSITPGETTAQDTRDAAREMVRLDVDLLLFAGGDGTARDVYNAIADIDRASVDVDRASADIDHASGEGLPVLGIPAGVKIHSAVFATNPRSAGDLAVRHLRGGVSGLREAEVMDIDEEAFRRGLVSARLYGYLKVPFHRRLIQGLKTPSSPGEETSQHAIAHHVVDEMEHGWLYVIGPGTTTRAITERLGVGKTLIGVDVVLDGKLVAADVNESDLLGLLETRKARIVVTPIGGQGYVFGRGNQQISPQVIKKASLRFPLYGKVVGDGDRPQDHLIVVSTPGKIHALGGRPLLVDTGDRAVDRMLSGYVRVVTGYHEQIVYKVSC